MLSIAAAASVAAQDISVVRLPQSTDMTVRLVNLISHDRYDRTGDSYFIVPAGRYSIQLLRDGQLAYQEVEFIGPDSPDTRTINPQQMKIVAGLPDGSPQFDPTLCSALITAIQVTVNSFGLRDTDVQRRMADGAFAADPAACAGSTVVEDVAATLAGSYGVTPLGMIGVSVEFTPLSPHRGRPPALGNSPIYNDPETQRLAIPHQPGSNVTPELISDLENGITDVAVDATGKPLLVCGAITGSTPLFCDSNGFGVATPPIAHLRGLFRFQVKMTPVDSHGVENDHWTNFVSEDEYSGTVDKLTSQIQAIQTTLPQAIGQLQAKSTDQSGVASAQSSQPDAAADLAALIETTEAALNKALYDPALQPLRHHFPELIAVPGIPQQPTAPEADGQKAFRSLQNTVDILARVSGDLGIDFVFRTIPVETEGAVMTLQNCARCAPITSQGGIHRLYRGRYYVKAALEGYQPYEGWLDLVADPKTILECNMVRLHRTANGRGTTCSLQAQ